MEIMTFALSIPMVYIFVNNGTVTPTNFGGLNTSQMQRSSSAGLIIANLPQLVVSMNAVLYNNVWIKMFLTAEFAKFASTRQYLRVSKPRGAQRSTYWLSLPFMVAGPIMASMAVLHWLVSRSVTFFKIRIYDHSGILQPGRTLEMIGHSQFAGGLALVLGLLLWFILIYTSFFKKLDNRVPVVSSCSIAIAAACNHAGLDGAAMLRLKYGVIKQEHDQDPTEKAQVGFSSRRVEPLEFNVLYE